MSISSDKPAILRITVRHSPTIKSGQRRSGAETCDWWRLSWGKHHIVGASIQHIACLHRWPRFDSQLRTLAGALFHRDKSGWFEFGLVDSDAGATRGCGQTGLRR